MLVDLALDVLLGLRFRFLDLSKKLFFFKCNPFSFKFNGLQFFAVFPSKVVILALTIFELLGLHLVFLIDSHNRFQITLHPLKILYQLPILMLTLLILTVHDLHVLFVIFLILNHDSDLLIKDTKFVSLAELQLL
jgi:hypothetical protein